MMYLFMRESGRSRSILPVQEWLDRRGGDKLPSDCYGETAWASDFGW